LLKTKELDLKLGFYLQVWNLFMEISQNNSLNEFSLNLKVGKKNQPGKQSPELHLSQAATLLANRQVEIRIVSYLFSFPSRTEPPPYFSRRETPDLD